MTVGDPQPTPDARGEAAPISDLESRGSDTERTLTSYLLAYEEALIAGREPPPSPPDPADSQLRERLERARDCLSLIQQLWPRECDSTADATLGSPGGEETWFEEATLDTGRFPELADPGGGKRLGRFRILRELGRGGFGVVFLAEDPLLSRLVALKVPLLEVLTRPGVRRRFLNEAKAAAALDHPNLVPVHEAGTLGPICYIACAYCDGPTLAEWIAQHEGVPIHPRVAAALIAALAEAMQHVHERGILHRDLKPSNVLLQSDPRGPVSPGEDPCDIGRLGSWIPRITDFGLSKVLDGPNDGTRSGLPLGSPSYMAPEQAQGRLRDLCPATDVYALGVILYELLTGRTPHQGETPMETLRLVISDPPETPRRLRPDVPRDLEAITLRCLEKEPGHRYRTAAALSDDLRHYLAGEPILARRATIPERAWAWAVRRPLGAVSLLGLALLPLLIIAVQAFYTAELRATNTRLEDEKRRSTLLLGEALREYRLNQRHLRNIQLHRAREAISSNRAEHAQNILDNLRPRESSLLAELSGDAAERNFAWGYLRRVATREIQQLRGHDRATQLAETLDGRYLVSCGPQGRLTLWDLDRQAVIAPLVDASESVAVEPVVSPDGRRVAALLLDQPHGTATAIGLWEISTGRFLAQLKPSVPGARLVGPLNCSDARNLSSHWILSDGSSSVQTWDVATDPENPRPIATRQGFSHVQIASDAARFAGLDASGVLSVYDLHDGSLERRVPGNYAPEVLWRLAPDGQSLSVLDPERGLLIWDLQTGRETVCEPVPGPVRSLEMSRDGRRLAVIGDGGAVHLRDRFDGRGPTVRADDREIPGCSIDFALTPDGSRIALSTYGHPGGRGPIKIFETATGRVLSVFPGLPEINSRLRFDQRGESLWIAGGPTIRRWWPERAQEPEPLPVGHEDEAWSIAFAPRERIFATGCDDGIPDTIALWNLDTGRRIASWQGHPLGTVSALAFSPDGRLLASCALEATDNVRLWDVANRRLIRTLSGHTDKVRALAFSPDGRLLATGGSDRTVRIWDVATGEAIQILTKHDQNVRCVAFHPDGKVLATAGNDDRLLLWETSSWNVQLELTFPESIAAMAFRPDGAVLATADEDGVICELDPDHGTILCRIHDQSELRTLQYSPDGTLLAAAGVSGVVRLWDPMTEQDVLDFLDAHVQINGVAFAPDGTALGAVDHAGGIHLWRADPAR